MKEILDHWLLIGLVVGISYLIHNNLKYKKIHEELDKEVQDLKNQNAKNKF